VIPSENAGPVAASNHGALSSGIAEMRGEAIDADQTTGAGRDVGDVGKAENMWNAVVDDEFPMHGARAGDDGQAAESHGAASSRHE
jgi:hypothetical protein